MYHIIMSTLNTSPVDRPTAPVDETFAATDDRALIEAFERLGPAYMRWVRSQGRPEGNGVSIARLRTLGLLRTLGPKPMGVLAKESGIVARTLTALVDGLERDGLARRIPHPSDRRATLIELTEEGERTLRACMRPHRTAVAALFREFAPRDRAAFARLIPLLVEAVEARTVRRS
jgi:DNA-binding MarR family transcriptional regulator